MAYALGSQVSIKSFELVESQTINLFHNEFTISVGDLQFHFVFKRDKQEKNGSFSIIPKNKKEVLIKLYNYSEIQLQGGYFEPFEMGYINGRKLYINFTVNTFNEHHNARVFTYNLYLGDTVNE
jgi:hypothetical protein